LRSALSRQRKAGGFCVRGCNVHVGTGVLTRPVERSSTS
jgi:hypothetical protein